MNGLKYIRIRCNLSLNELADMIGVTRQALSSWENGKKDIPEQRCEQLAEFFGIDKEYFGEISEEKKQYLLEKAMFRYDENGKETYRFKPQEEVTSLKQIHMCFMGEREMSLDEEYILAKRQEQEILEKIEDIIKWTDHAGSIQSQIMCIRRGCTVYNMINEMMEKMRGMKSYIKMPFFYELINVWKAMLVAYGLMDKKDINNLDRTEYYCGEDGEWIMKLSEQIKLHWDAEYAFHEKHYQDEMKNRKKELNSEQSKEQETGSIEEWIAYMEKYYRECIKKHTGDSQIEGTTVL